MTVKVIPRYLRVHLAEINPFRDFLAEDNEEIELLTNRPEGDRVMS